MPRALHDGPHQQVNGYQDGTTWQGMQEMRVLQDSRMAGHLGNTFKKYMLDMKAEEWWKLTRLTKLIIIHHDCKLLSGIITMAKLSPEVHALVWFTTATQGDRHCHSLSD